MNKISCEKVNMLCFFLWLINKVYQKTMKVDLLIILYMPLIANFCIWTCITTLQIDINSFINMHMNLWSNLPQIKKNYDELWGKVPYSYDMGMMQ